MYTVTVRCASSFDEHVLLRWEDAEGDPTAGMLLTGFELDRIEALQRQAGLELDMLMLGVAA